MTTTLQDLISGIPDLRNGHADSYTVVHLSSGIAPRYYSIPHASLPNPKTSFSDYLKPAAVIYAVRSEMADRRKAIIEGVTLACVRAGARSAYMINQNDCIANQTMSDDDVKAVYLAAVGAAPCVYAGGAATELSTAFDELDMEDRILSDLVRLGIGLFVTTGVTLVRTSMMHHHVDPHKGISTVVITQLFGSAIPFGMDKETFSDLVCHKACHVYSSEVMSTLARQEETKTDLNTIGLGSAGVRVPAERPFEQAAGAFANLITTSADLLTVCNVNAKLEVPRKELDAIAKIKSLDANSERDGQKLLAQFETVHAPGMAFLAGLLQTMLAESNQGKGSLLSSYAIKRVMITYPVQCANGGTCAANAAKLARSRAKEGILTGTALFGADKPTDIVPKDKQSDTVDLVKAIMGGLSSKDDVKGN